MLGAEIRRSAGAIAVTESAGPNRHRWSAKRGSSRPINRGLSVLLLLAMTISFVFDRLRIHPDVAVSVYRPLYVVVLLVMAGLLLTRARLRVFSLTPLVRSLLAFDAALLVSLIFAYDLAVSLEAVMTVIQLSLAGLLVGVFLINFWKPSDVALLAATLCWVTVVSATTVITDYVGITSFKALYVDRSIARQIGILGEPNFAAGKLAIGFPLAVMGFVHSLFNRRSFACAGYGIACLLVMVAIILTGSRMGLLMMAIIFTVVVVKERRRLLRPAIVAVIGLVATGLCLMANSFLRTPLELLIERTRPVIEEVVTGKEISEASAAQRGELLRAGWDIFREHPLVGVGMDGYRKILSLYRPYYKRIGGDYYAHNTFVEILVGTGLLGFLPFGLLILCILKNMWLGCGTRDQPGLPFYFALSFVMVLIQLFFLSDYPNRYLWSLFLPVAIYWEWLNARADTTLEGRARGSVDCANHME